MKKQYVGTMKKDFNLEGQEVTLQGWISGDRKTKNYRFLDLVDSTGVIQIVVEKDTCIDIGIVQEASVEVKGVLRKSPIKRIMEIAATEVKLIGGVEKTLSPSPRDDFDVFDPKYADYVMKNRHLFIRNKKLMAALKARHLVMGAISSWLRENGFIEITAPVLTPVLLYEPETGIPVTVNNENVFLTQCVAFYLESAVHAFEKVYNMGPSFRGRESISKRHLTEYWHVKAEVAFTDINGIISTVESLVAYVTDVCERQSDEIMEDLGNEFCSDAKNIPFPRIPYKDAVVLLNKNGIDCEFGKSLSGEHENFLVDHFGSPIWVSGNPRSIEGFPYCIDLEDSRLTVTADLISSRGFGELLGVAEKITNLEELDVRLREKGKHLDTNYDWFRELRTFGSVPHCGFGMGLERMIRWLYQIPHVRDVMPFPRSMNRTIYP